VPSVRATGVAAGLHLLLELPGVVPEDAVAAVARLVAALREAGC
jgi:hypothetical protein